MESYVIRIYRRNESEPGKMVGLVEHPENGVVERFSGAAELVKILLSSQQADATPTSLTVKEHGDAGQKRSNGPSGIQNKMVRLRSQ